MRNKDGKKSVHKFKVMDNLATGLMKQRGLHATVISRVVDFDNDIPSYVLKWYVNSMSTGITVELARTIDELYEKVGVLGK